MTVEDLKKMKEPVISGTMAARVIGMDSTRLIGYAREHPEKIQFPFQISGNRMKVPRIPFLRWLGENDQ
jgi:hypothetical protein